MRIGAFFTAVWLTVSSLGAAAETKPFTFPEGWFSLAPGEAGLVFMLRSYGGDTGFDLVDEAGATVDTVNLPDRRTVLAQYRVAPGSYAFRFFDKTVKVNARAGFFAAFGGAVTHIPASGGKGETIMPDYSQAANYTPLSMQQRVEPLAAYGATDLLPPKPIEVETLDFRLIAD